jgi:hypothetical protein
MTLLAAWSPLALKQRQHPSTRHGEIATLASRHPDGMQLTLFTPA